MKITSAAQTSSQAMSPLLAVGAGASGAKARTGMSNTKNSVASLVFMSFPLDRVVADFTGADAHHLVERGDEDLSVAHFPRARRLHDGFHGDVHQRLGHGRFHLDLRQE